MKICSNRVKKRDRFNKDLSNEKKMRCVFIIDHLVILAGTEKHIGQLVTNLNNDVFSCSLVAFEASDEMKTFFLRRNIKIEALDLDKIYGAKALQKFFSLITYLKSIRPDLVQTFHFNSDTFGVLAAKMAGVPIIVSSRRDMGDLKKKRQIYLNRLINPLINRFIAVCDAVGDELARVEKIPRNKITTIYNGIDPQGYQIGLEAKIRARSKLGIGQDAFVVGTVCILRPEKDVQLFLKAMAELRDSIHNLRILIVGDGTMKEELMNDCENMGLSSVTSFTGYIPDIRDHVQAMDVVCLTPKENEGLSNVILEEMAMGKPVVATDVGGNAELIQSGITGYIVPPGDRDGLVHSLLTLYMSPELRKSMEEQARRRIEEVFPFSRVIGEIEDLYMDLFNGKT